MFKPCSCTLNRPPLADTLMSETNTKLHEAPAVEVPKHKRAFATLRTPPPVRMDVDSDVETVVNEEVHVEEKEEEEEAEEEDKKEEVETRTAPDAQPAPKRPRWAYAVLRRSNASECLEM